MIKLFYIENNFNKYKVTRQVLFYSFIVGHCSFSHRNGDLMCWIPFRSTRILSKHFCLQPFFPKDFFDCLHENAFPTHFLALKHSLSVADKDLWVLWFGNKMHKIPSPKFVQKSWQHIPKSALLVGHTNFFVIIHDRVNRSCSV